MTLSFAPGLDCEATDPDYRDVLLGWDKRVELGLWEFSLFHRMKFLPKSV